jgi:hypothetical protein
VSKRPGLPDFGKYFYTNRRKPIDFACRDAPNFFHDVVFLASYIHDASFEIGKVRLSGKILRIPMRRDRWEQYKKTSRNLESIASRLVISPVLSLKWESKPKKDRTRKSSESHQFFVRTLYLGERYWDSTDQAEIVLAGFGRNPSKLRITVRDPFSIRLTDIGGKMK